MIYGIGVDIVDIKRIRKSLDRFGDRFARRILSDDEYVEFLVAADQSRFLAKRFAAKEALSKALGTGFRDGLSLRHISVRHDPLGRPFFNCLHRARELLASHSIEASHLSLSDEAEYALAYVTLERTCCS